jgi:exodeoxyribonuclease V
MSEIALSPDQEDAFDTIMAWANGDHAEQPFFKLFGWAGTGKTTLARAVADAFDGDVAYGAYTGKAAQVLRRKTGRDATTLHQLAYRLDGIDKKTGQPTFRLNDDSGLKTIDLLVVDECSMIDRAIMADLLSFGCPILCIGDPGQLPPVKGEAFFRTDPHAMLTEIHRQAAENPIIQLATKVRLGEDYHGINGTVSYRQGTADNATLIDADQILCGTNALRAIGNAYMRSLAKFKGDRPETDERVVCLKNNHSRGYQNGQTFTVIGRVDHDGKFCLALEDDDGERHDTDPVDPGPFRGEKAPWVRGIDQFDFGYVLTVHKAQGSEWDKVVLYHERFQRSAEEHRKWLYTAITRAANEIVIVE